MLCTIKAYLDVSETSKTNSLIGVLHLKILTFSNNRIIQALSGIDGTGLNVFDVNT